jgi:serine/threonine protein phosphatase PrpC
VSDQPPVIIRVFASTDVGRTRDHNEDAFVVAELPSATPLTFSREQTYTPGERGAVLMVADGMGGAAAGEIASSMAVDIVLKELRARETTEPLAEPAAFAQALVAATTVANERIHRYALDHLEYRGMGTTATVAGVLGDTLYIAQVGDSRAYLIRDGKASQITKDQSLMQRLIEAGEITAEEAEVSERRNIILQALGPEEAIKVDITRQQLRKGDTLVLCSDGLSGLVRDFEIAEAVAEERDLRALCARLITTANSKGGPDNITVVAARFEGAALTAAGHDDEVGHQAFPVVEDTPPGGVPGVPPQPERIVEIAGEPRTASGESGESGESERSLAETTLEIKVRRSSRWRMVAPYLLVVCAAAVTFVIVIFALSRGPR